MDQEAVQKFQIECERAFGFLALDYGFAPGSLEINERISFATVAFKGKNLAVQCIYDENEKWVEAKVARVKDGFVTLDYSFSTNGERVREELFKLLTEHGLAGMNYKGGDPRALPLFEMFRVLLTTYAEILKSAAGKDIVGDSATALDSR